MLRFSVILVLSALWANEANAQQRQPPVDWLSPCTVEDFSTLVWCGSYPVYENREAGEGRRIELNVMLVPARSENVELDPVFYFAGGPGGASTNASRNIVSFLRRVHVNRDLVFVDQRGTGQSNPLNCNLRTEDGGLQQYFDEFLQIDFVDQCLQELEQKADVSLYTTPIAMDDINEVREALGYDKINLYGASYGTRAALIFLRRHSEHVRSVVLKGVAPTNMKNPLPFARAAERGVAGVVEACADEVECSVAYPGLQEDWETALAAFENGPVSATVTHPQTRESETVVITKGVFADGIRHLLYTVRRAREVPLVINNAANGNFSPFANRELVQTIGYDNGLSIGMFLTVTCSEDVQFITDSDVTSNTHGTFFGDYRVRRQRSACARWKLGDIDESYLEPVQMTTPVLLFSGQYDAATPYEGGESVAEYMPNSLHIIVPNESHGYANLGCELRILNEFLINGSVEGIDYSCVEETRRPKFVVEGVSR